MSDDNELEFARTYSPTRAPESYEWVVQHGRNQIEFCHGLVDVIESKADALMRYVGAVALAISVGAPVMTEYKVRMLACLLPTFLVLAVASGFCMAAVRPTGTPALPSIHRAFRYADYFDRDAVTRFYATMVPLEPRLWVAINTKAKAVQRAWFCFWVAMGYLPVGVFWALS